MSVLRRKRSLLVASESLPFDPVRRSPRLANKPMTWEEKTPERPTPSQVRVQVPSSSNRIVVASRLLQNVVKAHGDDESGLKGRENRSRNTSTEPDSLKSLPSARTKFAVDAYSDDEDEQSLASTTSSWRDHLTKISMGQATIMDFVKTSFVMMEQKLNPTKRRAFYLLVLLLFMVCGIVVLNVMLPSVSDAKINEEASRFHFLKISVNKIFSLGEDARLALLSFPDLLFFFGGSEEEDVMKQLAKDERWLEGKNIDPGKLFDAIVSSPKFEAFVAQSVSRSNLAMVSRLETMIEGYEKKMRLRLNNLDDEQKIAKERTLLGLDHFKANFEAKLEELYDKKLPSLAQKLENTKDMMNAKGEEFQLKLSGLQSEMDLARNKLAGLERARKETDQDGNKAVLAIDGRQQFESLRSQLTALEDKIATIYRDFSHLQEAVSNCNQLSRNQENSLVGDISTMLAKALNDGNSDAIPETRALVRELKARFMTENEIIERFRLETDRIENKVLERIRNQVLDSNELSGTLEQLFKDGNRALAKQTNHHFSKDDLAAIIQEKLGTYDADKTGLFDFALESAGGMIESIRCTKTYDVVNAVYSIWGIPFWSQRTDPNTILRPGAHPGQCWAFVGHEGSVVIRLSNKIRIEALTLEHIPANLSPDGDISSAPKNFDVYGIEDIGDQNPLKLGNFTYVDGGSPIQTFFTATQPKAFELMEVIIRSNHGNDNYTCVYRVRVHGTLA